MLSHVTLRGNGKQTIFLDDVDYSTFPRMLMAVKAQFAWLIHTYCLMPNHYHLVVETEQPLSKAMHVLNGRYARRFNKRHGRTGHLFEGPYDAKPVDSDEYFTECLRYVADNPVRAGLCGIAADWPWSGGETYDPHRDPERQRLPPA